MEDPHRIIAAWQDAGDPRATLDLSNLGITSIPPLPDSVQSTDLSWNLLRDLQGLPAGLRMLRASHNQLTSVPDLSQFEQLYWLDLQDNHLTTLGDRLPPALERMDVSENLLTKLPSPLPPNLKVLFMEYNDITRIPMLPDSLQWLCWGGNPIEQDNLPTFRLPTLDWVESYEGDLAWPLDGMPDYARPMAGSSMAPPDAFSTT